MNVSPNLRERLVVKQRRYDALLLDGLKGNQEDGMMSSWEATPCVLYVVDGISYCLHSISVMDVHTETKTTYAL